MKNPKLNNGATKRVAQDGAKVNSTFGDLLRNYEQAVATGQDTTQPLYALAQAVALSVIAKCIDPQRKTAPERKTTPEKDGASNAGFNPALTAVRRDIVADLATLADTRKAHNDATAIVFTKDGESKSIVVNGDAERVATALQGVTLGDGVDLIHEAICAILEQTAERATSEPGWMEEPYPVNRLAKRVRINRDEPVVYRTEDTTPIQEAYRAVRRAVQNSRAMQTDPRNGYSYLEEVTPDGESIYLRSGKWMDLGGYAHNGNDGRKTPGCPAGYGGMGSQYTVDRESVMDYYDILEKLNLTERQSTIIRLRMSGYGYLAIATYLGIQQSSVCRCMYQVRNKCEKFGFTPEMWKEMTER